jgi:hypothetical protein
VYYMFYNFDYTFWMRLSRIQRNLLLILSKNIPKLLGTVQFIFPVSLWLLSIGFRVVEVNVISSMVRI